MSLPIRYLVDCEIDTVQLENFIPEQLQVETARRRKVNESSKIVELPKGKVGPLAQLVEQRTFNPWVVGSSPTGPTICYQANSDT